MGGFMTRTPELTIASISTYPTITQILDIDSPNDPDGKISYESTSLSDALKRNIGLTDLNVTLADEHGWILAQRKNNNVVEIRTSSGFRSAFTNTYYRIHDNGQLTKDVTEWALRVIQPLQIKYADKIEEMRTGPNV